MIMTVFACLMAMDYVPNMDVKATNGTTTAAPVAAAPAPEPTPVAAAKLAAPVGEVVEETPVVTYGNGTPVTTNGNGALEEHDTTTTAPEVVVDEFSA